MGNNSSLRVKVLVLDLVVAVACFYCLLYYLWLAGK